MLNEIKKNKWMILLLIIGAVYFFLKYIVPLTAPILVAMLFVTIFGSFLQKMEKKFRIHRQVGAVILLLLGSIVLGTLLWILFSWIIGSLPFWGARLDAVEMNLSLAVHRVCDGIGTAIKIDEAYLEDSIFSSIREGIDWIQKEWMPGILSKSVEYIKVIASVGAMLVIFAVSSVLLAKEYDAIMNQMINRKECHLLLGILCEVIRYIATYVKAQIIIMSSIGTLAAFVLQLCGVKQGILWGILAGFLDALPFVGTGIVLLPVAIVKIMSGDYVKAVICFVLYGSCIFLREYMEPKLIGRKVGISPILILISIYVGVKLFGIWGIVEGPLGFLIVYKLYIGITNALHFR